jgi:hypothetical protein
MEEQVYIRDQRNEVLHPTIKEIIQNIDKYDFSEIIVYRDRSIRVSGKVIETKITDEEQPLALPQKDTLTYHPKALYIDEDYYHHHKQEIEDLLQKVALQKQMTNFIVKGFDEIDERVLYCILKNESIKELTLKTGDKTYPFTKELFDLFKGTHVESITTDVISDELNETFDPLIYENYHKNLIGYFSYKSLQEEDDLYLTNSINIDELPNLRYINPNRKILLSIKEPIEIVRVLEALDKYNLPNQVVIRLEDRHLFTKLINTTKLSNTSNIYVNSSETEKDEGLGEGIISLDTYLSYENRLNKMVEGLESLSPYEKYLAVYNIVKKYKPYKENEDSKSDARNIYDILDNEYMVCVGYAKLLEDLLGRVGIEAYALSSSVDVGFDHADPKAEVLGDEFVTTWGGHQRCIVNLTDPKYGIDGYYMADPTWDNNFKVDSYTHSLMSMDEYDHLDRANYNKLSIYEPQTLLDTKSLQDFFDRCNYILNKERLEHGFEGGRPGTKKNAITYKDEFDLQIKFIQDTVAFLEKFDSRFTAFEEEINALKKEYSNYYYLHSKDKNAYFEGQKEMYTSINEQIISLIDRIGDMVVSKTLDKTISLDTLAQGIKETYKLTNQEKTEGEINEMVKETMDKNRKLGPGDYPVRKKIMPDGEVILIGGSKFNPPEELQTSDEELSIQHR